jgi:drug/metabolite transporter (DMT)-like permease
MMVAVAVFGAVDAVIVRQVSPEIHPFVIGFTRAFFGFLAFLPFLVMRPEFLQSQYRVLHVVRAALKLAALIAFFFAFAAAPLADVTAIAFAAPLFVTVGAWLFLAEPPRRLRIIAVLAGFCGVVLVLRPGQAGVFPVGLLFALVGAVLTALIQLILKPMTRHDSAETLVAWNLIVTVPIALIPAVLVWTPPSGPTWALLALQGALGALNMGLVTKAFSLAEASLLVPIEFLRLPMVAALGYVLFGQLVPLSTWAGGAIIFGATVLMARSARQSSFVGSSGA